MKKFGTKQIMPLVIIAICAVFLYSGLNKFGFWDPSKGPTAAFVPTIVCVMMIALAAMDFIKSLKDTSVVKYYKDEFIMIATGIVLVAAVHFIGVLLSLAIFREWPGGSPEGSWIFFAALAVMIVATVLVTRDQAEA